MPNKMHRIQLIRQQKNSHSIFLLINLNIYQEDYDPVKQVILWYLFFILQLRDSMESLILRIWSRICTVLYQKISKILIVEEEGQPRVLKRGEQVHQRGSPQVP